MMGKNFWAWSDRKRRFGEAEGLAPAGEKTENSWRLNTGDAADNRYLRLDLF